MKKFFSILNTLAALCLLLISFIATIGCDPEPEPCDPPTEIQVTALSDSSATLTWTAPPSSRVEISVVPQSNPPGPFITDANSITLNGLTPGTNYTARLRTICADGDTSEVSSIQFRTSIIVIGDVIIQKEVPSGTSNLCTNNNNEDVQPQSLPINWQSSSPLEVLQIVNGSTTVFIVKNTSGSRPVYSVLDNGIGVCGAVASNAPRTVNSTSTPAGFLLTGTGFTVEITDAQAQMTASGTTTYTMYR
jgi:hypothetical protein